MSFSPFPSSQSSDNEAVQDIIDEIAFQNVLLSSIDNTVDNREAAEQEIKDDLKTLERRLKALRRKHQGNVSKPVKTPVRKEPFVRSVAYEGERFGPGIQQLPNMKTPTSTQSNSDAVIPSDNLPSPNFELPSRKRSHRNHLDGLLEPHGVNKSRRTSPSPRNTRSTTPATSSGDEDLEAFDKFFLARQQDAEEKLKREHLDAEFARSIQNESSAGLYASQQYSSTPSAFDKLAGVRHSASTPSLSYLGSQGGPSSAARMGGRDMPIGSPLFSREQSILSGIKHEGASHASPSRFNPQQYLGVTQASASDGQTTSRSTMPGDFVDEFSDADDSDLEIIDASAFHGNARSRSLAGVTDYTRRMDSQNSNSQDSLASSYHNSMARHNGGVVKSLNGMHQPIRDGYVYAGQSEPSYSVMNGLESRPGTNFTQAGNWRRQALEQTANFFSDTNRPGFSRASFNPVAEMIRRASAMTDQYADPLGGGLDNDARMLGQVRYIVNDPHKTQEEIKTLLENIRPDTDLPPEDREGTPEGLVYPLYEHQKLALTWMKSMEEGSNKGGILADDMGLGKTISTLALLLTRPSNDRARKTTLIVGPVALVRQWDREIRLKVKASHRMSTYMLHGQIRKPTWDDIRTYDVVLTTYGTLGAEFRRREKFYEARKVDGGQIDQNSTSKLFPLLGPKSLFYRIILDEAQCIKNKQTVAAQACCHLKAQYRFCLTGTPMMNNVGELYSLIHFLRIKPYNEWARFSEEFGVLTKGGDGRRDVPGVMRKLQTVLKAILLRRVKTSLIDGKPIISLPPKTEEIQHVVFSNDEQEFYNALESKTRLQFNKYLKAGTVGKHYSSVLVLLLRLRQACCHPHLIHDFEETAPGELSVDTMLELARTLEPNIVARILSAEDSFECPICYDGVQNPSIVIPCGHDTCSECLSKISDQARAEHVASGEESGAGAKCPTCRGKIEMNKIIDYATFKKAHKPDRQKEADIETASESSDGDTNSDSDSDDDADSDGDLRGFVVPDGIDIETTDDDEKFANDGQDNKIKLRQEEKKKRQKIKRGKKREKKPKKEHLSLAMLKKESNKSIQNRRRYMKYLRKNWQPSAKVEKCVDLIEQFQKDGLKTIVFSQFVSLLDLLQVPIEKKSWAFERYDGSMNSEHRNDAIVRFTDKPDTKVMLISLKAGNAGLNLVAASRVIILDPFWNPYIEMQAVDRAYRIGQQKSVEVHRILIEGTVEDRIIELQESKRELVDAALDEGANKSISRLDVRQLAFLFGVGDGNQETPSRHESGV